MDLKTFLGVDIGGTKCAAVLGDESARVIKRREFPTGACVTPEKLTGDLFNAIDSILTPDCAVAACGISCGGPLNSALGTIESPPNLPLLKSVPIARLVSGRYKVKTFVQNDANACALAEWRFGAGRGSKNMIFLTFGTGLGAGLILGGRLYTGANDMAGEVGHVRMAKSGPIGYNKPGSLEGFCSGGGIKQLGQLAAIEAFARGAKPLYCQDISLIGSVSARSVVEAADFGCEVARGVLRESAEKLGAGLSVLIDILNPDRVVIGSIYQRAERYFKDIALSVINTEALPVSARACQIVPAELGDSVGDIACLSVAIDGISGA